MDETKVTPWGEARRDIMHEAARICQGIRMVRSPGIISERRFGFEEGVRECITKIIREAEWNLNSTASVGPKPAAADDPKADPSLPRSIPAELARKGWRAAMHAFTHIDEDAIVSHPMQHAWAAIITDLYGESFEVDGEVYDPTNPEPIMPASVGEPAAEIDLSERAADMGRVSASVASQLYPEQAAIRITEVDSPEIWLLRVNSNQPGVELYIADAGTRGFSVTTDLAWAVEFDSQEVAITWAKKNLECFNLSEGIKAVPKPRPLPVPQWALHIERLDAPWAWAIHVDAHRGWMLTTTAENATHFPSKRAAESYAAVYHCPFNFHVEEIEIPS